MTPRFTLAVTLSFILKWPRFASGSVIISEIAGKGSSNVCADNDWIELHNTDSSTQVELAGYILHDDKGIGDDQAFVFPQDYDPLLPGEYRLLCTKGEDATQSPQFAIGGDDTVTLVSSDGSTVVSSVGPLPDIYNDFGITYAWDSDGAYAVSSIERPSEMQNASTFMGQSYYYTSTPTPGQANILTQAGETQQEIKERLARQNEEGTRFFGMDSQGFPVDDAFDQVLDFHMTMEDNDYEYMMENKGFEVYVPFQSARLTTTRFPNAPQLEESIASLSKPGRIRTKGYTSLYFAACLDTTVVPFQVEFNSSETLFGVQIMYLRNHFIDPTYMRDWAMNRMLARFGLPHLRSRHVRLFINGDLIGFYTLVEAIDEEYVFARSFPDYNPFNYALYKWKAEALGCGRYDPDVLAGAEAILNDPSKPPYSFQRGTHRSAIPVHGKLGFPLCMEGFGKKHLLEDQKDVASLYLKYGENCGEMLVDEGLMDRKLGTKNWDAPMKDHVNKYLTEKVVDGNSDMDTEVDVENYLKLSAFYAVLLNLDSPLGHGNNFYMAQTGRDGLFNLVPYDFNMGPGAGCDSCGDHMVHWSIARPTCDALEFNRIVGPILLKPEYHARYIEHVRDFVERVIGADDLIDEILSHAQSIQRFARDDFWGRGNYNIQFSTDPADWNDELRQPLVPFLLARADSIREQLAAIDAGTFPRGPHQAVKEEIYEECVDWRTTQASEVACYNGCIYEGCYENNWRISHQCLEQTGECIHGTYDLQCRGTPEGGQYIGMESPREYDGLDTFCFNAKSLFPIKASVCPDPPTTTSRKEKKKSSIFASSTTATATTTTASTASVEIKAVPDALNGGI